MLNTRCMLCLELADGTMLPVNESRLLCEKLMRRGIVRTSPATLLREREWLCGVGPAVASGLLSYDLILYDLTSLACVWVVGRSHIGCTRMRTRTVTCC